MTVIETSGGTEMGTRGSFAERMEVEEKARQDDAETRCVVFAMKGTRKEDTVNWVFETFKARRMQVLWEDMVNSVSREAFRRI